MCYTRIFVLIQRPKLNQNMHIYTLKIWLTFTLPPESGPNSAIFDNSKFAIVILTIFYSYWPCISWIRFFRVSPIILCKIFVNFKLKLRRELDKLPNIETDFSNPNKNTCKVLPWPGLTYLYRPIRKCLISCRRNQDTEIYFSLDPDRNL